MVTPELRWPMTAATLASTSFCATVVPTFGSAWSSSLIILKVTGLPSMVIFFAFASATARATPFSSSLPRWAIEPVSGPAWAMVTVAPAGAAGFAGPAAFLGSSFWPQAARPSARATARLRCRGRFMRLLLETVGWGGAGPRGADPGKAAIMGSGVSSVKPGMLRKCRTHGIPACAGIIRLRRRGPPNSGSLDPEDPLHQGLHVLVLDAGVGGHRHLAPVADSALLHLLDQHRFGLGIALVLLCDFPVGRPDQLLVDRVASGAGVLLRELLAGEGGGGDCDGREQQGEALHLGGPVGRGDYRAGGILGNPSVSRNFSGESTGCRQVTPSHTQALTVSDAGFASTGGNPTVPAGMNSE